MTKSLITPLVVATGAGATLNVAIPDTFNSANDIKVYKLTYDASGNAIETLLSVTVDYETFIAPVAGSVPLEYSGSITTVAIIAVTEKIAVLISPSNNQNTSFIDTPFNPINYEAAFDLDVCREASTLELLKRSVRLPFDYMGAQLLMPAPVSGKILSGRADGKGWENLDSIIGPAGPIGPQGPGGPAGTGSGDMLISVFDPTGANDDAFDMGNMAEDATAKVFTDQERSKLGGIDANAKNDQTGSEIKTAYEAEAKAFTDTQFDKIASLVIATQTEMEAAASTTKLVSPANQVFHPGTPKVIATFDATVATPVPITDFGVSSITDLGLGLSAVVFDTDFTTSTYAVFIGVRLDGFRGTGDIVTIAVGSVTVGTATAFDGTLTDANLVCVAAFGDQ